MTPTSQTFEENCRKKRNGNRTPGYPKYAGKKLFQVKGFQKLSFLDLGRQNANRRSDCDETSLTPPTYLKKAVGKNGI